METHSHTILKPQPPLTYYHDTVRSTQTNYHHTVHNSQVECQYKLYYCQDRGLEPTTFVTEPSG